MIVIPEAAMLELMMQITSTTHSLTDTAGNAVLTNTIAEPQLRMAAIIALQVATGAPIWPGDKKIVIKRPRQSLGIFEEQQV